MSVSRRTRERSNRRPVRHVPADGSPLTDPRLGYLITPFSLAGDVARPGQEFDCAIWSNDRWGRCSQGRHARCPFSAGGAYEDGLMQRDAHGREHKTACGCDCHGAPRYEPPAGFNYAHQARQRGEHIDADQLALF